jgi:membrane AbrB-like protein
MSKATPAPKPAVPLRQLLPRMVLALAIGVGGGALFFFLHLPLPWMLGALTGCVAGALLNLPIRMPEKVRPPMSVIIGVMLGSTFTPQMLAGAVNWWPTIIGLLAFLVCAGAATVSYFRFVAGYDMRTAYFCGMPGGLVEMVLLADTAGADTRKVALVHAGRVMLVVFTVPFLVQWLSGISLARPAAGTATFADLTLSAGIWFAITAGLGVLLARFAPIPAPYMLGPMIVSLIVHIAGWTTFKPPIELVILAQVVMGTAIGCRFVGLKLAELVRTLVVSMGATIVMLSVTGAFAWGLGTLFHINPVQILLAYSPGGLMEMGLVALALNIEVAFVIVHHLARVLMVSTGAALFAGPLGFRDPPVGQPRSVDKTIEIDKVD